MKFLLDQNLSHRLISDLLADFPGSRHVREEGLLHASDDEIWRFARDRGFMIVSKDTDFLNRSLLRGHPPKVIQLRLGNCSTGRIREVLLKEKDVIKAFLENPDESLMVLE
jgi:predicted nuclease of predicted toxin-antitoxin system